MKNKKSQAVMEFLMTYGWAVLVILVAIGALTYFGVLSPERILPQYNQNFHTCESTCQEIYEDNYDTIFLDENKHWNRFCKYEGADDEGYWIYERNKCYKWINKPTRIERDIEATQLCQNLRKLNYKGLEITYPEYQEKLDEMQELLGSRGFVYLPESANLKDNKPRIMESGIEGNELYWDGSVEDGIESVWCVIPSETCFLITETTACQVNQDRMQFDYERWSEWYGKG